MSITQANIHQHELIGLEAEVIEATDRTIVGLKGTVVDETRNMLMIETNGKEKNLQKHGTIFRFSLPDDTGVIVKGDEIQFRPEDRVKRCLSRFVMKRRRARVIEGVSENNEPGRKR